MVARAAENMQYIHQKPFTAGGTVTQFYPVTLSSGTIANSTSNAKAIGIAQKAGTTGDVISVALLMGPGVIKVKVGTGGATAGEYAIVSSGNDGLTDQTIGGGTTVKYVLGRFLETGVAGDIVGLMPGQFAAGCA